MSIASVLLNAYYEMLYELLEANKDKLIKKIESLLRDELVRRPFGGFISV